MRLTQPTDFEILEAFDEHGRNVASNIAIHLDKDRPYINTRMPALADHGLIEKIGPAAKSGLYELTERGEAALAYRDQYDAVGHEEFGTLVEDVVDHG